jgi:hypothetical protein
MTSSRIATRAAIAELPAANSAIAAAASENGCGVTRAQQFRLGVKGEIHGLDGHPGRLRDVRHPCAGVTPLAEQAVRGGDHPEPGPLSALSPRERLRLFDVRGR